MNTKQKLDYMLNELMDFCAAENLPLYACVGTAANESTEVAWWPNRIHDLPYLCKTMVKEAKADDLQGRNGHDRLQTETD